MHHTRGYTQRSANGRQNADNGLDNEFCISELPSMCYTVSLYLCNVKQNETVRAFKNRLYV